MVNRLPKYVTAPLVASGELSLNGFNHIIVWLSFLNTFALMSFVPLRQRCPLFVVIAKPINQSLSFMIGYLHRLSITLKIAILSRNVPKPNQQSLILVLSIKALSIAFFLTLKLLLIVSISSSWPVVLLIRVALVYLRRQTNAVANTVFLSHSGAYFIKRQLL